MANNIERKIAGVALAASLLAVGCGVDAKSPTPSQAPSTSPSGEVATPRPSEAAGLVNPETAIAQRYGKDAWSQNPENWSPIVIDGIVRGNVLKPNPDGTNSIVNNSDGVGQAYLDAKVAEKHQAIALVLETGITMPLRGESIYFGDNDVNRAFEGALNLELQTQPQVYLAQVCEAKQAVPGNEQDLSNAPAWEAKKIDAQNAAKLFGRDVWSQNPENWNPTSDGYGMVLKPNPDGTNSVVEMTDAVGQAYWDARVAGQHQAIAVTLQTGTQVPVRGVTAYYGVPQGMEQQVADYALRQAVNLEIETQPGVYAVQVCKTAQAVPESANASWQDNIRAEVNGTRLEELSDGGLKIKNGPVITIELDGNDKIVYWDGKKVMTQVGPGTIKTGEATVYENK